jgi:Mg2+/citrate symporter
VYRLNATILLVFTIFFIGVVIAVVPDEGPMWPKHVVELKTDVLKVALKTVILSVKERMNSLTRCFVVVCSDYH